jgi:cell wall-associated NlpC family hydrolase
MIEFGKKCVGKPYVYGVEVNIPTFLKDPNPDKIVALDCSELVEVLYALVGINVPDGSYNQAKMCRRVPFESVLIGDMGFKWYPDTQVIHHVGLYLGNKEVLEAKGKAFGVVVTPYDDYVKSSHFAYWGRLKTIEDA